MKRTWFATGMSVLALGVAGFYVQAADVYVKAGAEGKGAKDTPYGEIWKALDKANRGDVIHVAAGTYNGKGGSGHFVVSAPNVTLVGGYTADFSARDPFKNLTIVERAADFKGDWTGLPENGPFISGNQHADHTGMIIDGIVMNGQSRNTYKPEGDININDSYKGMGIIANKANIKIRNCVILNPLGEGIYCAWDGKDNEIVNSFIVNTFYNAIATRSAQPDGVVRIANCTVAFCWYYPSKGGGISVFVGRQGKTIMENNVFAFNQTEGEEDGFGVKNTFGNDETVLKGNLFFQCQGGYYKYMDKNKQSLVVWTPKELKELNGDAESYVLAEASGNTDEDPKMMPDKDFFEKFSNFVASKPGKLNMDGMNEWRRSVGLNLQAEPGSARKNYGMAYPLAAVIPGLVSKVPGKGVQLAGPFATYSGGGAAAGAGGAAAAAAAPAKDYTEAAFASFKKGAAGVKDLAGRAVKVKVGVGSKDTKALLKNAPAQDYQCIKLLAPGAVEPTMDVAYGYLLKGTPAAKDWDKFFAKKDKYKDGVTVKGTAWYVGSDNYAYPVGIIIDEVSAE